MTLSDHEKPVSRARVLIIEDEAMIRMLLEDMLDDLGYSVAATAAQVEDGMRLAREADFDLAILDMNLNGQPVLPVADALAARGVPFLFASGYSEPELPAPHQGRPILPKPFRQDALEQALLALRPA